MYNNNLGLEVAAQESGDPLYIHSIKIGAQAHRNGENWREPKDLELSSSQKEDQVIITDETEGLLADMARDVSKVVKFPVSTAYLHALGVAASAMTKAFKYQYGSKPKPVTLYVCTAQPPSSGKSGINDMLLDPIRDAYVEINKKNQRRRRELEKEIQELEKSLAKPDIHSAAFDNKEKMLEEAYQDLENTPIWQPTVKDATIEAAEATAKKQTGMINIVSDEAEAINTIFGNTYVREGSKANYGLLLSAWDGDMVESVRVGREAYIGRARSSIAVLAQADSVESILRAGATGRGLAERFLLLSEKSLLGTRDHSVSYHPDFKLHQRYAETMSNIVNEKDVVLSVDPNGIDTINTFRELVEREMSDCGKYEHNLITGFMGKFDKQVLKIASVLHVCEHWQTGASREKTIDQQTVLDACLLFDQLSYTYINAADNLGFVGANSEVITLGETLSRKAEKNELKLSIRKLVNDIKGKKPFKGSRNLTRKIREQILPKLQENNYCFVWGNDIYINPRLK